jgi:hypothetical protein
MEARVPTKVEEAEEVEEEGKDGHMTTEENKNLSKLR